MGFSPAGQRRGRDGVDVGRNFAVPGALSLSGHPAFYDRYLIGAVPAMCLCAAYLLTRPSARWGGVTVAIACVWSLGPVADWYQSRTWEDWRAAAAYVDASRARGDHVAVSSEFVALAAGYYLESPPDGRVIRGGVMWVVTPSGARERVSDRFVGTGISSRSRGRSRACSSQTQCVLAFERMGWSNCRTRSEFSADFLVSRRER